MKSNLFLIAPFALLNTAYAFTCEPLDFTIRYLTNLAPGQADVTQSLEAGMIGRCDGPYGKFHADLTLYSVAQQHYCQLYDQKPSRKDWTPQDGTLLEGSQHLYEVVADPVWSQGIFEYDWSDQNFLVPKSSITMVCAAWYFTDATGQTQTPPATVCDIPPAAC